MHEVVLMAVRKAVSAATITFTANSMMRCFFMVFSLINCLFLMSHRFHRSHRFSALRALPLIRASASLKNGTQDFSIFNFQFIKVPSTPCSDASFASFQRLLLYSARHQHASFQASRQTTAGIPTNGSGHPDERQQVFPTPLPHRTKAARCALQRCSP